MFDKKINQYFDFIIKIVILLALVLLFYNYNRSSSIQLIKTEQLNKEIQNIQIQINNINKQIITAKQRLIEINRQKLNLKKQLQLIKVPSDTLTYIQIIQYIDQFINDKNDFLNGLGQILFDSEN